MGIILLVNELKLNTARLKEIEEQLNKFYSTNDKAVDGLKSDDPLLRRLTIEYRVCSNIDSGLRYSIAAHLERVTDITNRAILKKKLLDNKTYSQIADELNYEERQIRRRYRIAIVQADTSPTSPRK